MLAVGHSVLVAIYHMLTRHEPYRELGGRYFDDRSATTSSDASFTAWSASASPSPSRPSRRPPDDFQEGMIEHSITCPRCFHARP